MSLGPYTFIGPLWWQAFHLCSHGILGPSHVFFDLHTTATYARYLPDLVSPMGHVAFTHPLHHYKPKNSRSRPSVNSSPITVSHMTLMESKYTP
ncbi:hypothetical protein M405DRAFT_865416 [Rhizopogon salebrosus TDB-379]|nr:hypothetical protein M405DRAFT_865416 [Rhizopogon salebrosus TDB-379]